MVVKLRYTPSLLLILLMSSLVSGACDQRRDMRRPTNFDERSESAEPHFRPTTERQKKALERAKTLLNEGERQDAKDQLEALHSSTPFSETRAEGIVLLAELMSAEGNPKQGIALLRELEEISPPWGPLYFSLGRILVRAGEQEKAIDSFRDTIRADQSNLRAYIGLATLLTEDGQPREADIVMLRYERELYRLAYELASASSVNTRIRFINILGQTTNDPRISRILAQSLKSDSRAEQLAALRALQSVGTYNARVELEKLLESTNDPELRRQASQTMKALGVTSEDL